jgi:hypothetical protein
MSNMAFLLMIMIISSSILTPTLVYADSKAEFHGVREGQDRPAEEAV